MAATALREASFMGQDLSKISIMMLTALEALYICRKTTLAAESLGLAQPSMSVYLKQLRELTGDELFIRTSHGLEPTDFCHSYYLDAKEILHSLDLLTSKRNVSFDPLTMPATFSAAIPLIKGRMLFEEFSARLIQKYPRLKIDMVAMPEAEALRHVEDGLIDVYIGMVSDKMGKNFLAKKILKTELIVLCSDKSPHFIKGRIGKSAYLNTPHIKATSSLQPSVLDTKFKRLGLLQKTMVLVPNIAAEIALLRETDFLLVIDRSDAELIMGGNRFKILKTDFDLPQFDFCAVWHARKNDVPAQKWYRDYILTVCNKYQHRL